MAKKVKPSQYELIETARIFIENHLAGYLTPSELQAKLNRHGLNYVKINTPNKADLVFVVRGEGIERTELKF